MSLLSRLAVQAARAYGILSSNPNNVSADYLVVAGGGGGAGAYTGGGGGAGGYQTSTVTLSTLNTYSIAVGAGGSGTNTTGGTGTSGSNSVVSGTGLSTITSLGGGGGGGATPSGSGTNGASGGSGGGGGSVGSLNGTGGAGTSGQGNNGGSGNGINGVRSVGGGGGGAGAVGGTSSSTTGGVGGAGSASSISGSSVTYAGGGGGGSDAGAGGSGGAGGGGAGGGSAAGTAATANTGGGGGGGGLNNTGAAGGSGIVIISYTSATPKFVGGTITTSGGKQIHTFTSSGTLSPVTPITASYLVVAGGGSGGNPAGGGGGAGGLLTSSTTLYSGATYVVTVGAGGAGVAGSTQGNNGSNSVVSGTGLTTITATGGGSGQGGGGGTPQSGGSGGGAGANWNASGASGTSGQGNAGGSSNSTSPYPSGGGGGAGAAGGNGTGSASGAGGVGVSSSISGTATYYAGGGGGAATTQGASAGAGGNGGGGAGALGNGVSGTTNTGGGGGGAGNNAANTSGSGGSGIVIISYAGSQQFNGGLVTTSGGNTIHTFTSTGALTPLTNNLNNSLRFRRSASAYLNRTLGTPTNNKIWTYSAWVKRGALGTGTGQTLFGYGVSGTLDSIGFNSSEQLSYFSVDSGGVTQRANYNTSAVFRDPSAWYHIVVAVDTTQATAGNRFKLYVNGNQQTVTTTTALTQNWNTYINSALSHGIGWQFDGTTNYFDGYMTDINFIDGQALEPYYFGNNDANGVWKPIQYKGTYGTNGFYLTFGNTTSTTTLGYDSSPNGNNWTCNNISLTAGTTYDAMTDVPTNTSATVANYCVLNVLNKNTNVTVSNASLTSTSAVTNAGISGTMYIPSTGKYYWEATCTTKINYPIVGIANAAWNLSYPGATSGSYGYANDGLKYNNGSTASYGATYTSGDIIGVAFDADAGTLTFYKNNTSQGTAYTGLTDSYTPAISGQASDVWNMNFGQRPFAYTPPTGFVRLNTFNLPTPTILQGNKYMDATLWTGTGSSQVIVNQAQFKPDFVWIKNRSAGYGNILFDAIRGATNWLSSNDTGAEATTSSSLTSFNSNGFSIGDWVVQSNNGNNIVGWQWQAGQGSTSSNTSGSITSTVSVNATAGFSVVTYTGTGANATVGHGLGVAPAMIITRYRGIESWSVYHKSLGGTKTLYLNLTNAANTTSLAWNNTDPTSTVFSLGSAGTTNTSGSPGMVAYCWAEIVGFSKFGSYTGNGSADGPFVFCNFSPKWIMFKRTDSATNANWMILDTSRDTYNVADKALFANLSNAELTSYPVDILSNGFKIRGTTGETNASGGTYIYACFASNPFKNSNSR